MAATAVIPLSRLPFFPGRIEPLNTFKNKSFRDSNHWQGEL
jgi:hypothetical protein